MAGTGYIHPRAGWRATLDGQDLTAKLDPALISLRLTEKRGEAADELEIVLTDDDGRLALPPEGARIKVDLGWLRGTGVTTGMVAKGTFQVDEITFEGPPDQITITARSADLKGSFRTRKAKIWKDTTLGTIVGEVAGANDLTPRCHPDLAGKTVTAAEQANKSDMQFLRDLGRRYDAVATVKERALIFAPIDADTTATGKPIPRLALTKASGDRYSYRRAARENAQDGAEAQYHDADAATRKKATSGGTTRKRLKRVYASKGDATAAAEAETARQKRAAAEMSLNLAYGDPTAAPGMKVTVQGFKAEIDKRTWRLAEVEHTMDAGGGLRSALKLEAAE